MKQQYEGFEFTKQRVAYENIISNAILQVVEARNKKTVDDYKTSVETLKIICAIPYKDLLEKIETYMANEWQQEADELKKRFDKGEITKAEMIKQQYDKLFHFIIQRLYDAGLLIFRRFVPVGGEY